MNLFVFGEVVKTRGLKGCLKAQLFLESPDVLDSLDAVYLENPSGKKSCHRIRRIEPAGRFLFLELKDITDIDLAKTMIGCKLLMPRDMLKALPDDEYYWQDIIGLDAFTADGRHLGRIESIFATGSNDVYVCRKGNAEYLIPAIADAIVQIDLASSKITINLMEGLLP
jgi:16S rRNA processing protein RimM